MRKRQPAQEQQPHFTIEVQPRAIATELAALSDDAEVSYSCNIAGWQTTSRTSAKALRAQIEAIIERQGQGHYTLTEAAQILTDAGRVGDPESHLVQLQRAWADGSLPVHQGGSRYLRRPDEVICTHDDTVTVADLDDWLLKHQKTGHGFPASAEAILAKGEVAGAGDSKPKNGTTTRWTPENLAKLEKDHKELGTKEAARLANISGSRVRKVLARKPKTLQANDPFSLSKK